MSSAAVSTVQALKSLEVPWRLEEFKRSWLRSAEGSGWRELKGKLRQGDEIYYYKTDLQSWGELRGREGYVAIRGNKVIGNLLTLMN